MRNIFLIFWLCTLGISIGFVVFLAVDMTLNSGKFMAHALHTRLPGCSQGCHGETPEIKISLLRF